MRKILIGFIALLGLSVVGILVGPGLIDWNDYKTEIAAEAKKATGRGLTIAGDISVSVLPSPVIIIHDVAFESIQGAKEQNMVTLDSLEVRIALGPLLSGNIQVEKIRLVEPVIILEVLPDGRKNWEFDTPATTPTASSSDSGQSPPSSSPDGPGVQLDNFEMVNASLTYRDGTSGLVETISAINGSFKMASLKGPFISEGSLVIRDIPITYSIGVDGIYQGRTAPIKAEIKLRDNLVTAALSGDLLNLDSAPRFKGKTRIKGGSLGNLLAAFSADTRLPPALSHDFEIQGNISGSEGGVKISNLLVSLGETSASGELTAEFTETISAALDLRVRHLNLDQLLETPDSASQRNTQSDTTQAGTSSEPSLSAPSVSNDAANDAPITLPDSVTASLSLLIDGITYNEKRSGNVRLNAELSGGEITLSQFSANLPGATEIAVFGFASADDGKLSFDGESELSVGSAYKLAQWLGADLSTIKTGVLKNIKSTATIQATQNEVRLNKIDLRFDTSRLSGAATVVLRKRPGLGINLSLDRINLNDYLTLADSPATQDSAQSTEQPSTPSSVQAQDQTQDQTQDQVIDETVFAPLKVLSTFDANAKFSIGELVHNDIKARNIVLNITLIKNLLKLNDVRVDDLAGASISVAGALNTKSVMPRFEDLKVNIKAKSVATLAKALQIDLPVPAKKIGKVALSATLDGSVLQPAIKTKLTAIGATLSVDGRLSALPIRPLIDVNIDFKHGNLKKLITITGSSYRPSGKIGGIAVSTHLKGDAVNLDLTNLKGVIGKTIFNGSAQFNANGMRPKLTAKLATGEIVIDPYLPAQQASSSSAGQSTSASTSSSAGSSPAGAPWSKTKIDVAALRDFGGDLQITSTALRYGDLRLQNAVMAIILDKGVLNAKQISGSLFGGELNLSGVLDARDVPDISTTLSINNIHLGTMLSALNDQDIATGGLTFNTALAARGSSVADMVSALNGTGAFDVKALDVKGSAKGSPLAGLLGVVRGLGQFGAGLSGKSTEAMADASGAFTIKNGVADLKDMTLLSGLGNGSLTGQIDLANWSMDVSGVMHLTQNILTQLLSLNSGIMQDFPFSVSGSIDDPSIKFSTGRQEGSNPALPVIGEVPVIGDILEGVIGGILGGQPQPQQPQTQTQQPASQDGSQGSSSQPPPPPQQTTQPEQQPIKPQDILKQLFKF